MISFTLHDAILLATTLLLFYSQVSAYPMNSDSSYSCTPATSYASTVCSFSSTPPSSAASTPDGAIQPAASKESYAEILEMMNFVDQKLEILSNYAHRVGYNYQAAGLDAVATHLRLFSRLFRRSARDNSLLAPTTRYHEWNMRAYLVCQGQRLPPPTVKQDQLLPYPPVPIGINAGTTNINSSAFDWFRSLVAFQRGQDLLFFLSTHLKEHPVRAGENLILDQIMEDTLGVYNTLANLNLDDYVRIAMTTPESEGELGDWKFEFVRLLAEQ